MKYVVLTMSAALLCAGHPTQAQSNRITLHDAVRLALDYHPRLAAAGAAQAGAAAAVGEAKAQRLPNATAEATTTHFQQPMIVAPLHEFDPTMPPVFDRTLIQGRLTVGYLLFDGGRRGAGIGRAEATELSADAAEAAARMSVLEEVTSAYLGVLTATGLDEANRQRVASLEAERDRVELLLTTGRAARVELMRAEAALASARADLVAAEAAVDVAAGTLSRLVGVERAAVAPARLIGVNMASTSAGATSVNAVTDNPEVQQAQQRAVAMRAAERGARAAWLPTIRLAGGVITFSGLEGEFAAEWQAGFLVSYPLFTGGARSSAVGRAAAEATRAEEETRMIELQVQEAIERANASYRENAARVAALSTAVDHLTEVVRIEQLALAAGAGVQTDYLSAEADLLRARANLIRARYMEIAARVNLARTTGGLSVAWLSQFLENES